MNNTSNQTKSVQIKSVVTLLLIVAATANLILITREPFGVSKAAYYGQLAATPLLLLIAAAINHKAALDYLRGRSGQLSANTVVLSIAVIAILGIVNYLGYRYHKRLDLTTEGLYTLSDQTRKIVGNLQKDVKVIKFAEEDDRRLADQIAEFKYLSKRISYERIDAQQRPEISRQYAARNGETLVIAGERVERPLQTDEQSLVNAIMKVTRDKLKQVCFTEGHDEKSLSATEAGGYATVDGVLKNENYEVKPVNLATSGQVPAECVVLVSAGPKKSFLSEETAAIGKFLGEGGKVFLLLDPNTDLQLDELLKTWNIKVGNDTVLARPGTGLNLVTPVVIDYAQHPITKDLGRAQTLYPEARSVKTGDSAQGEIAFTEILKTLKGTWAETELKGQTPQFDEGKDTDGPVSIGVAASKKIGEKEARLVVIGDSDFAANGPVRFAANGNVFFNTVNWLAQDEDLISIRPKSPSNRTVTMTAAQLSNLWWLAVLIMPLAVIGAGAYIWWKRR